MSDTLQLILLASLIGISSSLVGVFLVLRRLSMLGDAISHTALFGIVLGFIITASTGGFVMVVSAVLAGLLTTWAIEFLSDKGKLSSDASIGVVFTWLFATAVIIISANVSDAHIDLDCVLFGELAFQVFERFEVGGVDLGLRGVWEQMLLIFGELVFLYVGFRVLKISSFDQAFGVSLGLPSRGWYYALMALVSLVTVVNMESVGAILVVAMLAVPANTAYLMARSVKEMYVLASLVSVASAVLGILMARHFDASPSAGVALASGLILLGVVLGKRLLGGSGSASLSLG